MILRKAHMNEAKAAFQCIEDAKAYQKSLGFVQWDERYPLLQTVEEDIEKEVGFVFEENNEILGYCCIFIGDELDYHVIDGAWKTDQPYAVIHRMAFSKHSRGKGLSVQAFSLIKDYCLEHGIDAVRIDTHEANKVMQRVLDKNGFLYCGGVSVGGKPRIGYEWDR